MKLSFFTGIEYVKLTRRQTNRSIFVHNLYIRIRRQFRKNQQNHERIENKTNEMVQKAKHNMVRSDQLKHRRRGTHCVVSSGSRESNRTVAIATQEAENALENAAATGALVSTPPGRKAAVEATQRRIGRRSRLAVIRRTGRRRKGTHTSR